MKRFTVVFSLAALLLAGFAVAGSAAGAEPSRLITQEAGEVLADGEVIADLGVADGTGFYTSQFAYQGYVPAVLITMGIWRGELSVGAGFGSEATANSGSVGYKMMIGPGAAYGRLNVNQVSESPAGGGGSLRSSDFDILVGYAVTKPLQKGKMNFNGEIILDSDTTPAAPGVTNSGSTAIIRLNGGVLMPVMPKLALVGELGIDLSNSDPAKNSGSSATDFVIGGGLRLTPNNKVTIDGMVLSVNSMSGNGRPFDSLTSIGTPIMIRAAFAF